MFIDIPGSLQYAHEFTEHIPDVGDTITCVILVTIIRVAFFDHVPEYVFEPVHMTSEFTYPVLEYKMYIIGIHMYGYHSLCIILFLIIFVFVAGTNSVILFDCTFDMLLYAVDKTREFLFRPVFAIITYHLFTIPVRLPIIRSHQCPKESGIYFGIFSVSSGKTDTCVIITAIVHRHV